MKSGGAHSALRDPSWIRGRRFAAGRGMGGQEREAKKEDGWRAGQKWKGP